MCFNVVLVSDRVRTGRHLSSALSLVRLWEHVRRALSALFLSASQAVSLTSNTCVIVLVKVSALSALLVSYTFGASVENTGVTLAVDTLSAGHVGCSALVARASEVVAGITVGATV